MNTYPLVLGQSPLLTGTRLGRVNDLKDPNYYYLWYSNLCTEQNCQNGNIVILAREERSYKNSNFFQTRWLLYKFEESLTQSLSQEGIRSFKMEMNFLVSNRKYRCLECSIKIGNSTLVAHTD